ncbi:transposase family protein [Streptomyces sp. NBC_01236]
MVDAAGCDPPGRCPECDHRASRVHSRYWRRIAGLPIGETRTPPRTTRIDGRHTRVTWPLVAPRGGLAPDLL